MQILIIAGGEGKRLQPLVTQKAIFPFLGLTLLEHTLKNLVHFSSSKTIIVTRKDSLPTVKVIAEKYGASAAVQDLPLGMADAVMSARTSLDSKSPLLIIDPVKVLSHSAFSSFKKAITHNPTSILLASKKVTTYKHGGYFVFDETKKIIGIQEKPDEKNMPSRFLKTVFDYFPIANSLFEALKSTKSGDDNLYELSVSKLIKDQSAEMVEIVDSYASLKYAPSVLELMGIFLQDYLVPRIDPTAQIAKTAVIDNNVEIAEGVRVFDHATIKGPAYIGANTIIGNGALVRESCIEADCEIGYNTEVARSYLGPRTKCHTSYIGDSIIEGNANLAAGTITANLRFDNKSVVVDLPSGKIDTGKRKFGAILARGVKTGIHSSLMPGTVLAKDAIYTNQVPGGKDEK